MDHLIAHPPLAAVDFSVLKDLDDGPIEGEPDLITELIDLYLGEVPHLIDSIRKGLEQNDWKSARRAAHTLRGSSGNMGVLQLSNLADKLERLQETEADVARALCESLEREFVRVSELLLEERQRRAA
ncbi:MAG TPA: Hpt domain-containing protein [Pyrinomonadaceae bacterium]|nr:Hpt domain-containing protein [Pyrinomonadaceae bacterium]